MNTSCTKSKYGQFMLGFYRTLKQCRVAEKILLRVKACLLLFLVVAIFIHSASNAMADWPRPEGPISTISMGVQAHFVSDDDGSRQIRRGSGEEAAAEVATWVDKANSIYSSARINFDFDPSANSNDWGDVQSTLINSMTGTGNADWDAQKVAGNLKASETSDKMSVFFRWGAGSGRTGSGFSSSGYDFVVMPEFNSTYVCGHQNKGLLAHEMGHYLGLAHTFVKGYSLADAETHYISNGRDPSVFDGDGRSDTHPDPQIGGTGCDPSITSVTLDGDVLPLPRRNIMSYYDAGTHPEGGNVSSSQAWTARSTALMRTGQSLTNLISGDAEEPQEGEDFSYQITGSGNSSVQSMESFRGKWSGNEQVYWKNGDVEDELTFNFNAPSDGQYNVYASFTSAKNYGIFDHIINGQTASSSLDLYSGKVLPTGLVNLGIFDLESGNNEWIAKIAGSNSNASSGNGYGLDFLMIAPALIVGDVNLDGEVDQIDIDAFVLGWKKVLPTDDDEAAWAKGDLNLDGVSDLADAVILRNALNDVGMAFDLSSLNAAVPEPSTAALLLLMTITCTARRKR